MIDGDHIAKAAVRDACGAFEVFETIAPAAALSPPHVSPCTSVLSFSKAGSPPWSTAHSYGSSRPR